MIYLLNLARVCLLLLVMVPAVARAQYRSNDVSQMEPAGLGKPGQNALSFVRNLGQWPNQVRFAARMKGVDLWITDSSVLYDLHTITSLGTVPGAPALDAAQERGNARQIRRGHLVNMRFAGASATAMAEGARQMEGHHNYFVGNDPARWATNVPLYQESRIRDLYPGISILLHFDDGLPRYDFLLEPNADPDLIKLQFDGADNLSITPSGELAIGTSLGVVRQQRLFAYQIVNGKKHRIPCSFRMLKDGTVGFDLGRYDARLPLVIDPVLYSTLLGGSGSDDALALAVDISGATCLTGYTSAPSPFASTFPSTLGGYSYEQHGNSDAFVTKISPTNTLVFSTIIGGKGFEDGRDISVDFIGNVYVTGFTSSSNFPTTAGAFSTVFNGGSHDAFVLKLSPDGSNLIYSTFVGGSHSDAAYGLNLDNTGGVRVTGSTFSEDFPTTAGAYDRTYNGEADIMSFTLAADGASMLSSTFIGGSGSEYGTAIRRDLSGRSCIVGTTRSTDFPVTASAAIKQNRGGLDAVVARVDANNAQLDYATYVGGSKEDFGEDISLDQTGNMVICGYTGSENFPVVGDAFGSTFGGGSYDGFACRIASNTGQLLYSSFIGGRNDDFALTLAPYGARTWIGGSTGSDEFRYTLPVPDTSYNGRHDGFVMLLDMTTDSLHYATFVGGYDRDVVQDIAYTLGARRTLHICGTTISDDFPTTRDAYQRELKWRFEDEDEPGTLSYDAFLMRIETTTVILLTETPGNQFVLCPNGTFEIRWTSFDITIIQLTLYDESGRKVHSEILNNNPASMVKWPWLIPSNHPSGTRFRLYISQFQQPQYFDLGSMDFTIVEGPRLIKGITSRTVCPGEKVDLALEAEGYNISYLWRRNGFTVFGANKPTLTLDSITARDTGTYEGVIYDACGSIALTQTVKLTLEPSPTITEQPVETHSCAGSTASLRVAGEGDDLRYQWYKDGVPVPGATSAELNILNVASQDEGYYTCHVMNGICPESPNPSRPARLKVVYERIIEHPRNQSVRRGEAAGFSVLAFGQNPTYQWRKDGENIPGAITSTYIITQTKLTDAGRYDVVVNGECEIISSAAMLTVTSFSGVTGERDEAASSLIMVEPNPVNARGVIRIATGAAGLHGAELALYDVLGRRVMDLTAALRSGGPIKFNAGDMPAGIYYCRLTGGDQTGTSTMVVVEK